MPVDIKELAISLTQEETYKLLVEAIYMDDLNPSLYQMFPYLEKGKRFDITTLSNIEDPMRAYKGCKLPVVAGSKAQSRFIEGDKVGFEIPFCDDQLEGTVLQLMAKQGLSSSDLTGTQLGMLLLENARLGWKKQMPKVAWFGDKSLSNTAYNMTDGFWKYIQQAVGSGQIQRESGYSNVVLGSGDVKDLLDKVYRQKAPRELRGMNKSQLVYFASPSIKYALEDDIDNQSIGSGEVKTYMLDGYEVVTYKGIQLVIYEEWDTLASDFWGQTTAQNLVVLTAKQNFILGNSRMGNELELFYDKHDMQTKIRAAAMMGQQIQRPELVAVAY